MACNMRLPYEHGWEEHKTFLTHLFIIGLDELLLTVAVTK